jgi:hypothetical protein
MGAMGHDAPLTSPIQPAASRKRKHPPSGATTATGHTTMKMTSHGNKGGSSSNSHNKNHHPDDLSTRAIMKAYPTSLEYHNMHGSLQLFAKDLYPMERHFLKWLGLHITGATTLSEMNLDPQKHKVLLHKVSASLFFTPSDITLLSRTVALALILFSRSPLSLSSVSIGIYG